MPPFSTTAISEIKNRRSQRRLLPQSNPVVRNAGIKVYFGKFFCCHCNFSIFFLFAVFPYKTPLTLQGCPELIFPIQGLPSSLTSLSIMRCNKFTSHVEFGLQGLPSLTSLSISDLSNHISLDGLGLQLLTSLRKLEIRDCPKLQYLTEERLPTSLSLLIIHNCLLLKDRCKFWTGQDWSRIAHIQSIVIDDQVL